MIDVIRVGFNETNGADRVNERFHRETNSSASISILGSTDITQPNFNPYYYLLAHKSNAT
jgi:hypothetical protein